MDRPCPPIFILNTEYVPALSGQIWKRYIEGAFLSICLLALTIMLCGCAHHQSVTRAYPRWGEEIWLDRPDSPASLPMRLLLPQEPASAPACVLLVHGMNEHIGRYDDIARYFARRYIVAGFDLYAHGLSNPLLRDADRALAAEAMEQDVSTAYLAQIPLHDLQPMRQDLDAVMHRLITECDALGMTGRPVFILSHSLGSLITASWLLQAQPDLQARIQGIIFAGPAFSVTQLPGWRGWLANPVIHWSFYAEEHFLHSRGEPWPLLILNQVVALASAPLFNGLFEALSWPGMRQIFTPVTPDWLADYLTDSEEERAIHRADGYIIRRSLLRYVKGIEREIVRFRRHMDEFATPYLLIYSGSDPITPAWGNEDFANATQDKHPDNQLLPLPDKNHHEHLFSTQPLRDELLQQIDRWLQRRLRKISLQN